MPRESCLSRSEKESLRINRFIFHIIIKGNESPIYLDEVSLGTNELDFFKRRIVASSEGTQFVFRNDSGAESKMEQWARVLENDDSNFVNISKSIADAFLEEHTGNTKDGVLVVACVSITKNGRPCKLLSLIKMDHSRVLQFETEATEEGQRRAILKEIVNTFVEDKGVIQKMALIDPSSTFAWDVLGAERRGADDDLAGYFKKFLGVEVRELPGILTRRAVSTVRIWLNSIQNFYPKDEGAKFKWRAINYMESHDRFEVDGFVDSVIYDPENPNRKQQATESLKDVLAEKGISGQSFIPQPNELTKVKRSTAKTDKNVKIMWDGNPDDRGIIIPDHPDDSGVFNIVIKSSTKPIVE